MAKIEDKYYQKKTVLENEYKNLNADLAESIKISKEETSNYHTLKQYYLDAPSFCEHLEKICNDIILALRSEIVQQVNSRRSQCQKNLSSLINVEKELHDFRSEIEFRVKDSHRRIFSFFSPEEINSLKATDDARKKCAELEKSLRAKHDALNGVLLEKKQSCPAMAKVFADLEWYIAEQNAFALLHKPNPAIKGADAVKELGARNRALRQQNKELEYQIAFWENLFPWLADFKEVEITDINIEAEHEQAENEYDTLKKWLSPDEYNKLSSVDKYQLALDRYRNRHNKTNWEIGIEYERYIGYLYETAGYTVEYRGALDGLQDMGRDLIARKGDKILVIQCKYWNSHKTIHEKHLFQLFGTVTLLKLRAENAEVKGIFITSAVLSETAARVAKELGIIVKAEYPMSHDYPCIKCNINASTHKKIYHLPFDQQYDKCVIDRKNGEFFAFTVQEAESKGFRRAFKWSGTSS